LSLKTSTTERGARRTSHEAAGSALALVPDEELARRAQEGSTVSFGELVDRYEARLKGYLRRRIGSAADVDDLTQEALVRAWRSLARFDPDRRFSTWLFTIATRITTDHFRAVKRERLKHERLAHESAPLANPEPSDGKRADLWDVAESVLSEEQLSGLWLRYAGDMAIEDIATVLGKSNVATRVMLFRARERLAKALQDDETPAEPATNNEGYARSEPGSPEQARSSGNSALAPGGLG